jgi:hypothetical protein
LSDTRVFPMRSRLNWRAYSPDEPITPPPPIAEVRILVGDAARYSVGSAVPVLAVHYAGTQVGFMTEQELREVLQHMQAMQQQVTA